MTPMEFKAKFTEFNSVDDNIINSVIDDCLVIMPNISTKQYNVALGYLVAHYLTIRQSQIGGDVEPNRIVTSTSTSNFRESYSDKNSNNSDELSTTSYGQFYLRIINCTSKIYGCVI